MHTNLVTTVTPDYPGIPRAMVLRLISCSPRRSGFFVTVISEVAFANLTPASRRSGPHDFAVREQDGGSCKSDLPDAESEIFLPAGLDSSKSGRRSDLPVEAG